MKNKFTEKHIGAYINDFYVKYKSDPKQTFYFDFSEYEWISNQNLLIITSIIKYLYKSNSNFKIKLFKQDSGEISKTQARTIIQLWEVWRFHRIFDHPDFQLDNYLENFNNSTIKFLKAKFKLNTDYSIYNRLGITPFVTFSFINNYKDDIILESEINPVFKLNEAIESELIAENCAHPFINETLSTIITKELYENFLDHFTSSFFKSKDDMCFMSISVKRKLGRSVYYLGKAFLNNLMRTSKRYTNLVNFLNDLLNNSDNIITQVSINSITRILDIENLDLSDKAKLIEKLEKEDFKNKQYIIGNSLEEEELPESNEFFKYNNQYRNEAYIHYTFLDYGIGIPKTIIDECKFRLN